MPTTWSIVIVCLVCAGLGSAYTYRDENRNNYMDSYQRLRNQNRTAVFCYLNDTQITQGAAYAGYATARFRADYLKNKLDLCTHLVYGAAYVTYDGSVKSFNADRLTDQSGDGLSFNELGNLKSQRPGLEIILSIAGDPGIYSQVARQHQNFVTQVKTLMSLYKFDGINIDWRYPGRREDSQHERQNFKTMIRDLRVMLRGEGKSLMASITHQKHGILEGYDLTNDLLENVDYWLVMAFEYFNHQSNRIGANAPIRSREPIGVERSVNELKSMFGEHSFRLILAVPFYGKQYQLRNRLSRDYDSPLGKEFINSHAPAESVMLPYREICKKLNSNQWRRGYDSDAGTAYAVYETSAIVYDDAESVRAKVRLALQNGLGGVMAYSVDMDDFTGACAQQDRWSDTRDGYNNNPYSGNQYNTNNNNNNNNNNYDHKYGSSNNAYGNNPYGGPMMYSSQQFPLLQAMHDAVQRGSSSNLTPSHMSIFLATLTSLALMKIRS